MGPDRADDDSRWSVRPVDAWRLLTEPMNEAEAVRAAAAISEAVPHVSAVTADPRELLVLAWDRRSVELFRAALLAHRSSGHEVPEHVLADLDEWLERAHPLEHPDVAAIEVVLDAAAARHPLPLADEEDARPPRHGLWLCPCVAEHDTPSYFVHDSADGTGLAWRRMGGEGEPETVLVAGGHQAPEEVLAWLRGEITWRDAGISGDRSVLDALEPRLRG